MPANSWSSVRNIHSWRLRIWKKNSLCNLINQQPDIDEIYFYTQDPYEAKYQLLIRKREYVATKHLNHYKAFIKYWNNKRDIYKNIEDYNPNKKQKILIVFDDMIAAMLTNKKTLRNSNWIIYYRQKKIFCCFHYTILFCCAKRH